jgi:hypothetical protein
LFVAVTGVAKGYADIVGYKCRYHCPPPPLPGSSDTPRTEKLWSKTASWAGGALPVAGEHVVIPSADRIVLDIADTPILGSLKIEGELVFKSNDESLPVITLNSKSIWVKGTLTVGSEATRYPAERKAIIKLHSGGDKLVLNQLADVGSKVLAVTGRIDLYGRKIEKSVERLTQSISPSQANVVIQMDSNFASQYRAGDKLLIGSTSFAAESEVVEVVRVNPEGSITVNAVKYFHYGAADATVLNVGSGASIDTRAEVSLLTRNVQLQTDDVSNTQGGSLVFSSVATTLFNGVSAFVNIKDVQISNYGKAGSTSYAAVKFQWNPFASVTSTFSNNVIEDSNAPALIVDTTFKATIENNVIYNSVHNGAVFRGSNSEINFNNNLINTVSKGGSKASANFYSHGAIFTTTSNFKDNIAVGCASYCYVHAFDACNASPTNNAVFEGNVAHSAELGLLAHNDGAECTTISGFVGYKLSIGVLSYAQNSKVEATGLILAENKVGASINIGKATATPSVVQTIEIKNSIFAASLRLGCGSDCYTVCTGFAGVMLPIATINSKRIDPWNWELPLNNPISDAVAHARTILSGNEFINYNDDSAC